MLWLEIIDFLNQHTWINKIQFFWPFFQRVNALRLLRAALLFHHNRNSITFQFIVISIFHRFLFFVKNKGQFKLVTWYGDLLSFFCNWMFIFYPPTESVHRRDKFFHEYSVTVIESHIITCNIWQWHDAGDITCPYTKRNIQIASFLWWSITMMRNMAILISYLIGYRIHKYWRHVVISTKTLRLCKGYHIKT